MGDLSKTYSAKSLLSSLYQEKSPARTLLKNVIVIKIIVLFLLFLISVLWKTEVVGQPNTKLM